MYVLPLSSRAPTVYYLPKSIEKILILDKKDENTRMIKIEYKENQSPLEDMSQKYVTTFLKDKKLQDTIRIYHGNERTQGQRGRGGRGRGGRGKGR